jgi:hypothetical protein
MNTFDDNGAEKKGKRIIDPDAFPEEVNHEENKV